MRELSLELEAPWNELSVVAVWNRAVSMRKGQVESTEIADLKLRLFRVDEGAGSRVLVQESDSPTENREHLYLKKASSAESVGAQAARFT